MNRAHLSPLFAALCFCVIASCASAADCDDPPRLRFSLVPQGDARKDATAFKPLFDALERELGKPVEIIYPSSYDFVIEGLLASSIDLAFMGPASYISARNSDPEVHAFASYSRKAGTFQEEGPYYRALLVVRRDSRFHSRESLRGSRLALVDPVSTSGAVLPRKLYSPLISSIFEQYFGRVVYTGGHDKSVSAVASGQVDAAFVASNHLSDYISAGKSGKDSFQVLWQSERIPLDPFVYRGKLCGPIKEKVRDVFLGNNGEGYRDVLDKLNAVRFVPINDDDYKMIREILRNPP